MSDLVSGDRVRDRNPGANHPDRAGKVLSVDKATGLVRVEWDGGDFGFIVATRLDLVPAAAPLAPGDLPS